MYYQLGISYCETPGIDKPVFHKFRQRGVRRQRSLRGVARRVNRQDNRGGIRRIAVYLSGRIYLTGIRPVSVVRPRQIRAGHKDSQRLVVLVSGRLTVGNPKLIIHIVVRVVLPFAVVHSRQTGNSGIFRALPGSPRFCLLSGGFLLSLSAARAAASA